MNIIYLISFIIYHQIQNMKDNKLYNSKPKILELKSNRIQIKISEK